MPPQAPREGYVEVGGYRWLARMIDKARLEAAGEIEPFDLDYPCPVDQRLLAQIGMDGKTFQQIAVQNPSDDAVLAALKQAGVPVY